jgi:DNA-binding MarR family transcriptional regulator
VSGVLAPRCEHTLGASTGDVEASRCILALARAEDRMDRVLEAALAPVGLTPQKFNVLMELAASPDGRLSLSEVGRRLIRSAANVTTLVDRLEADGLVRRVGDPADRRVTLAEITQPGWRVLRPAARAVFAAERRILRQLSPSDRRRLTRLLEGVEPLPDGVPSRRTDAPGADRFGVARVPST